MTSPLLRYRLSLGFFMVGLIVSGLTTFPLLSEASFVNQLLRDSGSNAAAGAGGIPQWIGFVHEGLRQTYSRFPFFAYGTDWLGFGHFVIAAFFLLPFRNPARYLAVLYIGLVACGGVIVVALLCGSLRQIPLAWQLIDCSFGVIGAVPLLYCVHLSRKLSSAGMPRRANS
jgi:hypothetical protein